MSQQIDIDQTVTPLRDFVRKLGTIREPIDLVSKGAVVARLIGPRELSERERKQILDEAWKVVDLARSRTAKIPTKVIQKEVDQAVREVRAQHAKRRR